jgi:hypothetical protein
MIKWKTHNTIFTKLDEIPFYKLPLPKIMLLLTFSSVVHNGLSIGYGVTEKSDNILYSSIVLMVINLVALVFAEGTISELMFRSGKKNKSETTSLRDWLKEIASSLGSLQLPVS